ncbi:MAG: response regulator [Armatimonadota bacterium]
MSTMPSAEHRLNVLVADDEEDVLEVFRMALEPRGHRVTTVGTGLEAVERAGAEHFDVAFLDVAMAPMDGLSTLARLKEASPQTKVIMITAFYSDELSQRARGDIVGAAMHMGAKGCLRKPFELDAIVRAAEYFGGQGAPPQRQPSPKSAPARPRVVIVSHETEDLEALCQCLQSEQWEVVSARDAEEALTHMRDRTPDVVICEQTVPTISGTELLELVQREFPDCLRVLATEAPDEQARSAAAKSAQILVGKPWQEEHLRRLVREALLEKQSA